MSATRELTYEAIIELRKKIDDACSRGESVDELQSELKTLTETWNHQLNAETSSSKILKG